MVGGGITGVSTAWMFAKAGLRVGLVESARIGRGSTAASTALLMQEPDTDFVELAGRYGVRRARRIWQLSRKATRRFIRTLGNSTSAARWPSATRSTTRPAPIRRGGSAPNFDAVPRLA